MWARAKTRAKSQTTRMPEGLEQGGLGPQIPSVKLQIEAPPVR